MNEVRTEPMAETEVPAFLKRPDAAKPVEVTPVQNEKTVGEAGAPKVDVTNTRK